MRTNVLIGLGLVWFMLPLVASGNQALDACQFIKMPDAEKILGKNLAQNPGELPGPNGLKSRSCFYSSQGWSNRTGSGAAPQFLEVTIWSFASPRAASAAFKASQAQMRAAFKADRLPAKLKGSSMMAITGYGQNAFVLETPVPARPPQQKPLVTRLYWLKGALQIEVMAWVLNGKSTSLELTRRAADLVASRLP